MRIVAGLAKGRRLAAPPGAAVRPTADRVREALFSSLQPRLLGAHVLDLYAGSGALGLEAASRGAARVVLVERDRRVLEVLRSNVAAVGLAGVEVVAGEVAAVLAGRGTPKLTAAPFDLVLADPPYATPGEEVEAVLAALVDHLAADAEVVLERDRHAAAPRWPEGLEVRTPRRYGATVLHRARRLP
ncbi:MAG: 16S rRNA (guanine(966)-N(2))-methyltransferase RsmD [Nitriliruptoraceae bacterium]